MASTGGNPPPSISATSLGNSTINLGSNAPPQAPSFPDLQQLNLRVMRLSRPTFGLEPAIFVEPIDLAFSSFSNPDSASIFDFDPLPTFQVSEILRLPSDFGQLFLGENFSCCVCVNNESTAKVDDIGLKVELQTSSHRFSLVDTLEKPRASLSPGEFIDSVIEHEIKELGSHILVCFVHYTNSAGERKTLTKKFKFPVQNPLAVKTKVYNVKDDVFLEAQIQNISGRVMCLDQLRFEPSPLFDLTDFNFVPDIMEKDELEENALITFDSSKFLNPQDVKQYLYKLSPKSEKGRAANTIGKIDIVWKTAMGERGRLQTSQLPRKVPASPEIEVEVTKVPEKIFLEEAFEVELKITNHGSASLFLRLLFLKSKMGYISFVGPSSSIVGELQSQQSAKATLKLFPIAPGLQRVGGIGLSDSNTGKVVELDNVTEVFVLRYR